MSLGSGGSLLILVSDLEESVRFYRDTLGLEMTGGIPGEFAFMSWGGITLSLRETDRPIVQCLCEISFQVGDVRGTYQSLVAKGIKFTKALRPVIGNDKQDLLATDFRDPDGHVLSINGWVAK